MGGPAFTYYLTPSEDELRSRYNPELLRKSTEQREEREQEFDEFVTRLKEYSKSDKPSMCSPLLFFSPWRLPGGSLAGHCHILLGTCNHSGAGSEESQDSKSVLKKIRRDDGAPADEPVTRAQSGSWSRRKRSGAKRRLSWRARPSSARRMRGART